jgi:aconitate hydratase
VLAENSLTQLIERKRDLDFPWFPARVVCHDILGQTALVDLAGLRDAIADKGGDPAKVNPVVPVQLIVDHSLAVECGGFDPDAFAKNRAIEDRRNEDRFHFIDWTKQAFKNVDVIPPGNGIMHQINLEKMSPVIQADGVAFPDTCVGTDSHTPHVDALGVIAIGVGGLEAENVMLGRASWMRLPDIVGVELTGKRQPGITATDIVLALTEFLRKETWSARTWNSAAKARRPDARRPRHHLQHGARVRRHGGDVLHRPADHRLPEADRPRGCARSRWSRPTPSMPACGPTALKTRSTSAC